MISDPIVTVTCDQCGASREHGLTAIARGGYDERNLRASVEGDGWIWYNEDRQFCDECSRPVDDWEEEA